jgi:hypothetical protein
MRRLNQRSLRILAIAEASKDHDVALRDCGMQKKSGIEFEIDGRSWSSFRPNRPDNGTKFLFFAILGFVSFPAFAAFAKASAQSPKIAPSARNMRIPRCMSLPSTS